MKGEVSSSCGREPGGGRLGWAQVPGDRLFHPQHPQSSHASHQSLQQHRVLLCSRVTSHHRRICSGKAPSLKGKTTLPQKPHSLMSPESHWSQALSWLSRGMAVIVRSDKLHPVRLKLWDWQGKERRGQQSGVLWWVWGSTKERN